MRGIRRHDVRGLANPTIRSQRRRSSRRPSVSSPTSLSVLSAPAHRCRSAHALAGCSFRYANRRFARVAVGREFRAAVRCQHPLIRPVPMHFHARYSAEARTYRTRSESRDTVRLPQNRAAFIFRPLDSDRMAEAATALVGSHDFSAFRSAQCQAKSPIRRMEKLTVVRRGEWITIEATANAYLHHMMRNIAGLLIAIGRGDAPPSWAREVLEGRDRKQNAATAPAEGLLLWGVRYPSAFALPVSPDDDPLSPSWDPRGVPGPG